jgi:hypothetical protein
MEPAHLIPPIIDVKLWAISVMTTITNNRIIALAIFGDMLNLLV